MAGMSRKVPLRYKKERLILSDVLPFEVPLLFSNRHFYDFLIDEKIHIEGGKLFWKTGDGATETLVRLLIGDLAGRPITNELRRISGNDISYSTINVQSKKLFETIPFTYFVKHKEDSNRELAVCHPRNQLALIQLFDTFKETILYYCSLSPFSIRKPVRISKYRFFKDRTHEKLLAEGEPSFEEYDKEYESLRSFFVYKEYNNVHKFYDSEKFLRCEKKFGKMLKLDISKCFSSIYTHSLPWALVGKENVKLNHSKSVLDGQFGDQFDNLMQALNRAETNGIIIGPEFSRIFAELVLQAVDRAVCLKLEQDGFQHREDYEIFRYVDDYFIFYDQAHVRNRIVEILRFELHEYKLHLNEAKSIDYSRPMLTNLTRAKKRIALLLDERLRYDLEPIPKEISDDPQQYRGDIRINPEELIVAYKTAVIETSANEIDLLNWSISVAEKRCRRIFLRHLHARRDSRTERKFVEAVRAILQFLFFAFAAAPRVNSTIRLCKIISLVAAHFNRSEVNPDDRDFIFQQIYEDVRLVLKKQRSEDHIQVETLYLLLALSQLGERFLLDEEILRKHFAIRSEGGRYIPNKALNYFSVIVLLYYIRKNSEYKRLRACLEEHIVEKIKARGPLIHQDAEIFMLMLDTIACPYVSEQSKRDVLALFGISEAARQTSLIRKRKYWFAKWTSFDIQTELDIKLGQEVY